LASDNISGFAHKIIKMRTFHFALTLCLLSLISAESSQNSVVDFVVTQIGDHERCREGHWLNVFPSSALECAYIVSNNPSCDNRYFSWANYNDNNCLCVDVGTDCKNNLASQNVVTTWEISTVTIEYQLVFRQTLPYLYAQNELRLNPENPSSDNYAILDELERFRREDGRFYFRMVWPGDDIVYEWSQTSNPVSESVEGYEAISVPFTGRYWGGLEPSTDALMDGSVNSGYWFYAVGTRHLWRGGIPSYAKSNDDAFYPQQVVELYVNSPVESTDAQTVPFSIEFGGQAWGMSKSDDGGATWTPIASIDMHTYQHPHMVGEVRDVAQEGTILKFQPLHDQLATQLGFVCPFMHQKCDGTCTFDPSRKSCFNWDGARIFLHTMFINDEKQDFSNLDALPGLGWDFQCRSQDAACSPPVRIVQQGNLPMIRQDGSDFYYTYTFTNIGQYQGPDWSWKDTGLGACRINGDAAQGFGCWTWCTGMRACRNDDTCVAYWLHGGSHQCFCVDSSGMCGGCRGVITEGDDLAGSGTQSLNSCIVKSRSARDPCANVECAAVCWDGSAPPIVADECCGDLTKCPSPPPTHLPTTDDPSLFPTTEDPTNMPTEFPTTEDPSRMPTEFPTTEDPSQMPTEFPTTEDPSQMPTEFPTTEDPSQMPTEFPTTEDPSQMPTEFPTTEDPTRMPTNFPTTDDPTQMPTIFPTTDDPTHMPTNLPTTDEPTEMPTEFPTTDSPSKTPSTSPSHEPSSMPSNNCANYVCDDEMSSFKIQVYDNWDFTNERISALENEVAALTTLVNELSDTNTQLQNAIVEIFNRLEASAAGLNGEACGTEGYRRSLEDNDQIIDLLQQILEK